MNDWGQPKPPPPVLSEAELEAEFIKLTAKYPKDKYTPFEIAAYIFEGQVDGFARSQQAATRWQFNLSIQNRIDEARAASSGTVDSKDKKLKLLQSIYEDPKQPVKERIAAIRLHAELQMEIKKPVEIKEDDKKDKKPEEFLLELSAILPG